MTEREANPRVRNQRGRNQHERNQHGAAAVEVALVTPALLLVLALLVVGGRVWYARTLVSEAGYAAARAASLAVDRAQAQQSGISAGRAALSTGGLVCQPATVRVATSAFTVPPGTPATITATVRCTVSLSDVTVPGVPGRLELDGTGSAALDTYRSRG